MKISDYQNMLKDKVAAAFPEGTKISYPAVEDRHTGTRLDIRFGGVPASGHRRLKGGVGRHSSFMVVNCHLQKGSDGGEDLALDMAETVAAEFRAGSKHEFTNGTLTVQESPEFAAGVPTETDWYIPVTISFTVSPS